MWVFGDRLQVLEVGAHEAGFPGGEEGLQNALDDVSACLVAGLSECRCSGGIYVFRPFGRVMLLGCSRQSVHFSCLPFLD